MSAAPTVDDRYRHMRDNAEAFVESMAAMIAAAERDGKPNLATKLKVWCLDPWKAAIRDDDASDLWPKCEVCAEPIKSDADRVSGEECDFHRSCVEA